MRFLKVLGLAVCFSLSTCVAPERSYPLPEVADNEKKMEICLDGISFFKDSEFKKPLRSSLADTAREEAAKTLMSELKARGFRVEESEKCSYDSKIHIWIDVGLRSAFPFNFFLLARVCGYTDLDRLYLRVDGRPNGREIFQFLVETEVKSDEEKEVRRAGEELATKMAKDLHRVLGPKPQ